MLRFFLFILVLFISIDSYSSDIDTVLTKEEKAQLDDILSANPQDIYDSALENIRNSNYDDAIEELNKIEFYYSHSLFYFKAKLLLPYVYMLNKKYELASSSINLFLSLYPEYKDIDFVYYLRGEIHYNHAFHQSFGRNFASKKNINIGFAYINAVDAFNELINNYPDSKYVNLSQEKITQINDLILSSRLGLARYYQRDKKSLAALKILYFLVEDYGNSKFMPEVMFRIIEIYHQWGLDIEVENVAMKMQDMYPNSFWTTKAVESFVSRNAKLNEEKNTELAE